MEASILTLNANLSSNDKELSNKSREVSPVQSQNNSKLKNKETLKCKIRRINKNC